MSWPKLITIYFVQKGNIYISWIKTIMKKGRVLFLIILLSFEIVARPVTIKGERNEWWIGLIKKCPIICDLSMISSFFNIGAYHILKIRKTFNLKFRQYVATSAIKIRSCSKRLICFNDPKHNMAIANLIKIEELVTNNTAASKYIPERPRIWINWNPPFWPKFTY